MMLLTDSVGGGAEDLHQDVFISARSLHGLPQLLHSEDDGRVQHGKDGVLKVPRQFFFQNIHQLLSQRKII